MLPRLAISSDKASRQIIQRGNELSVAVPTGLRCTRTMIQAWPGPCQGHSPVKTQMLHKLKHFTLLYIGYFKHGRRHSKDYL